LQAPAVLQAAEAADYIGDAIYRMRLKLVYREPAYSFIVEKDTSKYTVSQIKRANFGKL